MELEKFSRQLKLMTLLAGNVSLTVADIARRLDMSSRTVYRYIRAMKDSGLFHIEQQGDVFRIARTSPFFAEVSANVSFSEDEASTIAQLLASTGGNGVVLMNLRRKLERIYNYRVLDVPEADRRTANNLSRLYEAVKTQRVVVLKNYHSLRGDTVSDRVVEPFCFLNSNDDIRCFELSTATNKTFKVSRADDVLVLDLKWSNAARHETFHTDLFGFTDRATLPVTLRLTARAAQILREERPAAAAALTPEDDGHALLRTEVCSYRGIGRFVLGLYNDVEIVSSPDFEQYIREEVKLLTQKFGL